MNIAQLIRAAEFLERKDREAEHGYAAPATHIPDDITKRRPKSKKSQGNRSTHNELEKNRRAHLRHCLENLKDLVPLGQDCTRHTTLGLLTKAKSFIKALEEKERRNTQLLDKLTKDNGHLQRKIDELSEINWYRPERNDVDILGYNSTQSDDSEDRSSIDSDGFVSGTGQLSLDTNSNRPTPLL
ncbi:max dimerization protein 1-like [Octopus bimaculoides]|uniref:max dimerization protein 1-like n=1 Tax=Octopus bimaculoides TaxID=37653 RepID=UPI00071C7220|nr:max dimerization protein 1-like [Octopus bimaculoides]|eukprot:XP_014770147.1 PREDICTED: max dimerization protein 1-like [Octopus bimaculoides]